MTAQGRVRPYQRRRTRQGLYTLNEGQKVSFEVVRSPKNGKESAETFKQG